MIKEIYSKYPLDNKQIKSSVVSGFVTGTTFFINPIFGISVGILLYGVGTSVTGLIKDGEKNKK